MDVEKALEHVRSEMRGVLATSLPSGMPHLTVVFAAVVEDALWISSVQTAVKVRNLRRDARASFCSGIRPWVTVEGTVVLHDGDDVLERLRLYYRTARGEHPDWDDYDRAMVRERRLIIELLPARAYGLAG